MPVEVERRGSAGGPSPCHAISPPPPHPAIVSRNNDRKPKGSSNASGPGGGSGPAGVGGGLGGGLGGGGALAGSDSAQINSLFHIETNLISPLGKSHLKALFLFA